jgi:RNA polymerase sigma factor (sigma-70 family)
MESQHLAHSSAFFICRKHPQYFGHMEDATQEAEIAIWLGRSPRFAVWDYLRAVGASIRYPNGRKREEIQMVIGMPEPSYEQKMAEPFLLKAIAMLKPQQQQVLFGKFWEEKTDQEMAADMGINHQRVNAIKQKAIELLKAVLVPGGKE